MTLQTTPLPEDSVNTLFSLDVQFFVPFELSSHTVWLLQYITSVYRFQPVIKVKYKSYIFIPVTYKEDKQHYDIFLLVPVM